MQLNFVEEKELLVMEIPVSLDFRNIQESEKFGIKIRELDQKILTHAHEFVKFILSKVMSTDDLGKKE